MALSISSGVPKDSRVKHSFNANDDSEALLKTAGQVVKDKTEFINRCIQHAGPLVLRALNDERNKALAAWLREESPPPKRKAG